MIEEMKNRFLEAEQRIREQKYEEAEELLQELKEEKESGGRAEFNLGNIALLQGNFEKAVSCYEKSLQQGYEKYSVWQNLAQAKEKRGELKQAEALLKTALEKAADQNEEVIVLYMNCLFYYRNEMLLKAEKAAKKLTQLLPSSYDGHHLLIQIWQKKQDYECAQQYLLKMKDQFGKNGQYLVDRMCLLELQGKYEEELQLIDQEAGIMEVMPEEALMQKLKILLRMDRREEGRKVIQQLFQEFGNVNAAFSTMMLSMAEGKYLASANIAHAILKGEGESGNPRFLYYITMFIHIFIMDMAFGGTPTEEALGLMKKEADICVPWLRRIGVDEEELKKALELVLSKK